MHPSLATQRGVSVCRSFSLRYITSTAASLNRPSENRPPYNPRLVHSETEPPRPSWKLGDGAVVFEPGREDNGKKSVWDLSQVPERESYQLLVSAVVPRPIALVSSLSGEGVPNLAPFSYFSMVAHSPPIVSLSFSIPRKRAKDTRENILATNEFTVNIVDESLVHAINATSAEAPAHVDEWVLSGLSKGSSVSVKPATVLESPVSFECKLYSSQDIHHPETGELTTTVVFGLIKQLHIKDSVLSDDRLTIDPGKLRPISRLGGTKYGRLLGGFSLPRVSWKASEGTYKELLGKKER